MMHQRIPSLAPIFFLSLWAGIQQLWEKGQIELAGYIAYASFLAFFPFLLILWNLMAFVGQSTMGQESLCYLYQILPPPMVEALAPLIETILLKQQSPSDPLLLLSLMSMLWMASSGVEALRTGLNKAYDVREPRHFWTRRVESIGLVCLLVVGAFFSTIFMILLPMSLEFLIKLFPPVRQPLEQASFNLTVLQYGGTLVSMMALLTFLYRSVPCRSLKVMTECVPGAGVATLVWILMAKAFTFYIEHMASYSFVYGSLGGIALTLIFFHLSALAILYGAEVNRAQQQKYLSCAPNNKSASRPKREASSPKEEKG